MTTINTNISAIQSMTQLRKNTQDLTVHLQRLSTGLRINSGKDDPAGLIASENLRSEMAGITQGISNSTRADSVISTAEGALNEVSSLLLSVKTLVNASANSGGLSSEELQANQSQIDSAVDSINRIANSTDFEGVKLLNGNMDFTTSGVSADLKDLQIGQASFGNANNVNVDIKVNTAATNANAVYGTSNVLTATTIQVTGGKGVQTFNFLANATDADMATAINTATDATGVSATVNAGTLVLTSTSFGSSSSSVVTVKALSGTFDTTKTAGTDAKVTVNGIQAVTDGLKIQVSSPSLSFKATLDAALNVNNTTTSFAVTGGGAQFQLGPTVNSQQQAIIGIQSVAAQNLGSAANGYLNQIVTQGDNNLISGNVSLKAQTADRIVSDAISQVANLRGQLGAFQKNTLATNINSLNVALQNITSSESAIRDADFAQETSSMTRSQILVQAGTSVLAIANSAPQNVLKLLG